MADRLGDVDRKALAKTAVAAAVVVAVVFLGWWAWKGLPGVPTRRTPGADINTSTNQGTAEAIANTGDNLLGQNQDNGQPGQQQDPAGTEAAEDPEAERELAEIRRRIEEERQQLAELARQAEYAPLGQSLHALTAPSPNDTDTLTLAATEESADSVNGTIGAPSPALPDIPDWDETPIEEEALLAGTVIPISLITAIDSGLPGLARAQVTAPVRDSVSGTRVLIPPGSLLIGTYSDNAHVHAERLFVYWRALQRPDGSTVQLEDALAADLSGIAGIEGQRKSRFWRTLGAAFAINLVTNLATREDSSENQLAKALNRATGDTAQTVTERMLERDLNASPTFRIPAGTRMNVVLEQDLWLAPYKSG
ncbi:MAG: TrbI/VirB10 family protein [Rhodobacteraceae bacterium]|nr:TrbI/VirB10 family protein [Paracoccaceae bacterium]